MKWRWIDIWAVPLGLFVVALCLLGGVGFFLLWDRLLWNMATEDIDKFQFAGIVLLALFSLARAACWAGVFRGASDDPPEADC